jgi:hypothetical protein
MRMRRYLAAECLVLTLFVTGVGLAARGIVHIAFAAWARPASVALGGALATPVERDPGALPNP